MGTRSAGAAAGARAAGVEVRANPRPFSRPNGRCRRARPGGENEG